MFWSELVLFQVCTLLSPGNGTFTPERNSAKGSGARVGTQCGPGCMLVWSWNASLRSRLLQIHFPRQHQQWLPSPHSDAVLGPSCLCSLHVFTLLGMADFTLVRTCTEARGAGAYTGDGGGLLARALGSFNLLLPPCSGK